MVFTWVIPKPRVIQYDSQLGWSNKANLSGIRQRPDGLSWEIATDSQGRRVTFASDSNHKEDIVFLGDSFTFGDSIQNKDHFISLLSRDLNAKFHNLGVVGYTSDQELLAFKKFNQDVNTLVLMTYLGNDLRDLSRHFEQGGLRFKPKFELENNSLLLKASPYRLLSWLRNKSYLVTFGLGIVYSFFPNSLLFEPQEDLVEGRTLILQNTGAFT